MLHAFDLLFLDGEDLRQKTLEERRLALGPLIRPRTSIAFSEEFTGAGADLFRIACENELEGIVSKRLEKPYRSGRRRDLLKVKCVQIETFVIISYLPGSGAVRVPVANLKAATFDGTRLQYSGTVGTGFGDAVGKSLRNRLDLIAAQRCIVPRVKAKPRSVSAAEQGPENCAPLPSVAKNRPT